MIHARLPSFLASFILGTKRRRLSITSGGNCSYIWQPEPANCFHSRRTSSLSLKNVNLSMTLRIRPCTGYPGERSDKGPQHTMRRSCSCESFDQPIIKNMLENRHVLENQQRLLENQQHMLGTQKRLAERVARLEEMTSNYTKVSVSPNAADFKIYNYLQKRVNEVIKRCPNAANDIKLCPDIISIVVQRTHSTFLEKFKTFQPTENTQSDISVFIGADDELFEMFHDEVMPGSIVCRIQSQDQISSHKTEIIREEWGFQYNAPDLSDHNIIALIDDVLERVVLEKLARAVEALPKQGKRTEGIICEVKEFFTDSQVPMPNWLEEWEPDSKGLADQNRLEMISEELLTLPYVFTCDISNECIEIMLRRRNESHLEDLIKRLKNFRLSNEEYNIHVAEIKPLSDEKFKSGDGIQVQGSNAIGTLGGFAELKANEDEHPKTVVFTAKHVVDGNDTDNKEIEVNKKILGKVMETEEETDEPSLDIAIGEVTAHPSTCDTSFQRENGDKGFAEVSDVCPSSLVNKRIHLWGYTTSPGAAEISSAKIQPIEDVEYLCIEMLINEGSAFAEEGDSGSMVLMERHPRFSTKMLAIGTLVGEVVYRKLNDYQSTETVKENVPENLEDPPEAISNTPLQTNKNKKKYAVVPLKMGFDQLAKKHGGSLTLFTSTAQQ